jgi:hypothetical protein
MVEVVAVAGVAVWAAVTAAVAAGVAVPACGPGLSGARPGGMAPMTMRGANAMPMTRAMTTAPMTGGRVQGWAGRTAWNRDRFHDHFHNRFRNRNFFAFGFGGPYYDTAYNSCWAQVPSYYGWQWVYVCGDYPYGY